MVIVLEGERPITAGVISVGALPSVQHPEDVPINDRWGTPLPDPSIKGPRRGEGALHPRFPEGILKEKGAAVKA